MPEEGLLPEENVELEMLRLNKKSGYKYRKRRHNPWTENYTLYRDRVSVNRLTQRQSVNVPMMKMMIRSMLKDVDDMPVNYFENLDNDKEAEVFQNEYWKLIGDQDHNKFELLDIIDKKQVFLFGRSFDQWQIEDGMIKVTVEDPQDILVSRHTDPVDIHTSRFLIHTHIYVPLAVVEANPDYDKKELAKLKTWAFSEKGIIKVSDNEEMVIEKAKKMEDMGMEDVVDPVLGETYIELTLHFVYRKEKGDDEEQLYLYVEAEDQVTLMKKRLEKVIGTTEDNFWRNHFPYNSWADDLERQDFWSDAIADIIRTPNKVVNSWFSQLVENRTLRNFGMHYYDSSIENFTPNTFNPVPWGWYPIPGKPADVLQKVDIPELSESLDEMKFVIEIAEKATGAVATQQGAPVQRQITLGEVQLALGEAKERIKGMSKFYTPVWQQRGRMFLKLIEAASDRLDAVKIYKKGRNTSEIYSREIEPKDWMTKAGYRVKVWSQDEKRAQDTDSLTKMNAMKIAMPDNPKVDEIFKRKLTEFADLTSEEINEIMEFEQRKRDALLAQPPEAQIMQPGQPMQPGQQLPVPQGQTQPPMPT